MKAFRIILTTQTVYYALTAIWALVDINSFMLVTGPKTDIWLVKTVAVLLLAISAAFIAWLCNPGAAPGPAVVLAISCCICLACIDIYYAWNKTISAVYLLDAIAEIILLICWIVIIVISRRSLRRPHP